MIEDKKELGKARKLGRAAEGVMERSSTNQVTRKEKAPPAQDRWFDTQLSRMYADLAAEPLPKDMMALLEKLKAPKS